MTFDCVTILVDLVLADVFEAWKEIYSEAMHPFLAFSSWPTLSQLKCFLERWTLSGNSTASTIGFFSPSHVAAKRQCCCRSREARIQMGWHCFFFFLSVHLFCWLFDTRVEKPCKESSIFTVFVIVMPNWGCFEVWVHCHDSSDGWRCCDYGHPLDLEIPDI